jgi:hypothetical protein
VSAIIKVQEIRAMIMGYIIYLEEKNVACKQRMKISGESRTLAKIDQSKAMKYI